MIGEIVFFPLPGSGERLGLVVHKQPRTGLWVVAYEATAGVYKAVKVERVEIAHYATASLRKRALRRWAKRALIREARGGRKLKKAIREAYELRKVQP